MRAGFKNNQALVNDSDRIRSLSNDFHQPRTSLVNKKLTESPTALRKRSHLAPNNDFQTSEGGGYLNVAAHKSAHPIRERRNSRMQIITVESLGPNVARIP